MKEKDQTETGFTDRQQRLLVELVRTPDIQAAAQAAGVGRSTVYRWLSEPEFAAALQQARDATYDEALNALKSLTERATHKLAGLMETEDDRLLRHVCNDVLRHAIKTRELDRIEARLDAIEHLLTPLNPEHQ
jgi:phage terminase small subunit